MLSSSWHSAGFLLLASAHITFAQTTPAPSAAVVDARSLRASALEVDKHMAAHYRKFKLPVPANADDLTLLRRTYLVAVGRIPSLEEVRAYTADSRPDKHARLVESLLASPGYASHMTNWLMDLLRVKDEFNDSVSAAPYVHYLRDAVASNKPWHTLSTELLTAEGQGWNGAPATGYFVRDKGMPLDNTANTMRIFLGSRMECAQCHDHPYAKWTRKDFYELAAFFHGIDGDNDSVRQEALSLTGGREASATPEQQALYDAIQRVAGDAHYFSIVGGGSGNIPIPSDYQYRNAKPGEVIGARAPFGPSKRMSARREGDDGRKRFVAWMLDPENPQFTQTIANRMWKRIMGRGLYEPIDEFIPPAQTISPELMAYLNGLMKQLGYDLRAFQQVLLLTRSFRFDTNPNLAEGSDPNTMAGRQLERLGAEQIWDSLLVLAKGDKDIDRPLRQLNPTVTYQGKALQPGTLTMAKLQRDLLDIDSGRAYLAYMKDLLADNGTGSGGQMMQSSQSGQNDGLVRASELPYPPHGDHFLRRFGASSREVIEGNTREGTVPQVLSLVNGEAQTLLVENPSAAIIQALAKEPTDQARLEALFLAVLTRPPTPEEVDMLLLAIDEVGTERGWRNILSAMLCTHEFLFLR